MRAHLIAAIELVGQVQDDGLAVAPLDQPDEDAQFAPKGGDRYRLVAITEIFEVDRGRQRVVRARYRAQEIGRLLGSRAAQAVEMIGAAFDARGLGAGPVGGEGRVDIVAALGRLDIGDIHSGIGEVGPAYLALIVRLVDALARVELG